MANRRSPLLLFLLAALTTLLSQSCALTQAPPPVATYLLETAVPSEENQNAPAGRTVVVLPPKAAAGYNTALMAYQRHPGQVEYFSRHRWADQPSRMLWPLLVAALENAHFQVVMNNQSAGRNPLTMATELLRLRQEFTDQGDRVEVAIRIQLADPTGDGFLATKVFSDSEPVLTADPVAGVQAANRILTRLLPTIAAWCVAAGPQNP